MNEVMTHQCSGVTPTAEVNAGNSTDAECLIDTADLTLLLRQREESKTSERTEKVIENVRLNTVMRFPASDTEILAVVVTSSQYEVHDKSCKYSRIIEILGWGSCL